ncbi:MAG: hypothetical protein R6V18_09350 [Desulfuromonadaceae bacterium]
MKNPPALRTDPVKDGWKDQVWEINRRVKNKHQYPDNQATIRVLVWMLHGTEALALRA